MAYKLVPARLPLHLHARAIWWVRWHWQGHGHHRRVLALAVALACKATLYYCVTTARPSRSARTVAGFETARLPALGVMRPHLDLARQDQPDRRGSWPRLQACALYTSVRGATSAGSTTSAEPSLLRRAVTSARRQQMPLQIGFVDGFFPRVVPTALRMSPRPALSVVPPLGLPARRATVATLSTTSKTLHGLSRRERFPRRKMPRGMASQRTPRCSLQCSPCLASPASSSHS